MCRHPLVSVIVVCYNAADYIIETLESVKAQTYKNIELIVSDDYSKDGTADIARLWLSKNDEFFVRTELVSVDHNTGVSANYNRAVKACRGEWVKNIDGDDLITSNCIQDNVEYVTNHTEVGLVFSNGYIFKGKNQNNIIGYCIPEERKKFFELSSEEQFLALLKLPLLPSQTCFVRLNLLQKYPYNERYKALEDAPMWVMLTKNGIKAHYFDSMTAFYRKDESMTSGESRFYSPAYVESAILFFWNDLYPSIKELGLNEAYSENRKFIMTTDFALSFLSNKKTRFNDIIFRFVRKIIYKYARFVL